MAEADALTEAIETARAGWTGPFVETGIFGTADAAAVPEAEARRSGGRRSYGRYVLGKVAGSAASLAFVVVLMPLLGKFERPLPLPRSISEPVLREAGAGPLPAGATAKPMEKS